MAILRGFPPTNTIAPGVRIAEKDNSLVLPEQSFHRAGLVGFASKGPINIPTQISTVRQLHNIFGFPHPEAGDPYLIYAAEQYLQVANELFIVRVGASDAVNDEAALTAEVDIPSAGGQIAIISDTPGDYSFAVDSFFRWRLNSILSSKSLIVPADDNRDDAPGDPYTCDELVEVLNAQLVTADGIEFYTTDNDELAVRTTFAYGPDAELELVSIQDAIYGGAVIDGNVTGLGTGMTAASVTGSETSYPDDGYSVSGSYNFSGLTGLNLQVVIDGTDNVNIDNVVQVIDLSDLEGGTEQIADIVAEINGQIDDATIPGGFVASVSAGALVLTTLHHGRDARMLVKSASSAATIFGLASTTAEGTSPIGSSGDAAIATYGRVNGDSNSTGEVTFVVTADTPGVDGNNTQVVITNNVRESVFTIDIYNDGVQVETWGNLTKDTTNNFYVETYLTIVSDWIRVTDDTSVVASPLAGTYSLDGGTDGIPADADDQDDLIVGSSTGLTGIYTLSEPEQFDIDLLAIPGHTSTRVIEALIDVAETRADCLAIVDPPFGLTVKEIIQWQNGQHPLNDTRFNSDFAALYYPWVKIKDTFNGVNVWAPPSGVVMASIARSDQLSFPWFAPAGLSRGLVNGVLDVFTRPSSEDLDSMYGNRNCINPIVNFADVDAYVIMGQKTMQRTPTALDRINVRRMLFFAEKRIRRDSRELLFDPHDDVFHQRFIGLAKKTLDHILANRGLYDYRIQADFVLNDADVIDRNEFRALIGVQPTKAVEFMLLEFSVHRTGSFTENADTF